MKTVTLNIPDHLDLNNEEVKMFLAASLYEKGKLSLGEAAELVGISKRSFTKLIGKYGIYIQLSRIGFSKR